MGIHIFKLLFHFFSLSLSVRVWRYIEMFSFTLYYIFTSLVFLKKYENSEKEDKYLFFH